jgi:broad specificity phosphatase PhoE
MSKFYFLTHPEVQINPEIPVPQWSLSKEGWNRVSALFRYEWLREINLIYSSEELKAHQTAEIIANHLGLEVYTHSRLGEVDRSSTGYLQEEELKKTVKAFFEHPEKSVAGWESAELAQKRIATCVRRIIETNPQSTIAIVSHGMVGALLFSHLKNLPIDMRYMQQDLGSYFIYDLEMDHMAQEWRRYE